MKDILFFSHNQKKIIEVKQIFKNSKTKVYDLNSFEKIKEPKETGVTFASNAKIKSKYGQELFNMPCFADDSGFCVEALKNNPGIKSKRFLEKFSNNKKAFEYIISNVIKNKNNKAFFCYSHIINPNRKSSYNIFRKDYWYCVFRTKRY
ncbi:non-canonical purine NTP pyrophosphatase [Alphaproteobacteria bacterium]|nr:non-canonical purine NTP pyrophosphatase [Alphaproteobacteria bacterium]